MRPITRYISKESDFYLKLLVKLRNGNNEIGLVEDEELDAIVRRWVSEYYPELIIAWDDYEKGKKAAWEKIRELEDSILQKLRQDEIERTA